MSNAAQMANINFVFITYSYMGAKHARREMARRCANTPTASLKPIRTSDLNHGSVENRVRSVAYRRQKKSKKMASPMKESARFLPSVSGCAGAPTDILPVSMLLAGSRHRAGTGI
jgi:hypothetical protein